MNSCKACSIIVFYYYIKIIYGRDLTIGMTQILNRYIIIIYWINLYFLAVLSKSNAFFIQIW